MKLLLPLLPLFLAPGLIGAQTWLDDLQRYREERLSGLLADPRQPLDSANASGVQWFEADERYRLHCTVEWLPGAGRMEIPTYSGIQKAFRPAARLHFRLDDQPCTLTIYQYLLPPAMAGVAAPYFLPFKDETNGTGSYGGGRYLDIDQDSLTGDTYLLDLNRAYNPLCAYGDGFNCPIPPRENHLNLPIPAGEKAFAGTYRHRD